MIGKMLDVLDKILSFFEDWTLFISVIAALIALFFNVVLRYGFNYTLAWSEELVREVIIYTTFIGCCAAVKKRSMIKIDASVQLVPKLKTTADILQQPGDSCFFCDDDGLWVANGRHAGQNVPKDTDSSDSAGLSVCNFTIDWCADVYSNASGHVPGFQAN
jgi:hypothetical protein